MRDIATTGANIRPNPNGDWPAVDPTAYVDPTAQLIGNVRIGPRVFIGPNAVLRADECDGRGRCSQIRIGAECNVQDGVIVHALAGTKVLVGERTSLSHGCIVHGPCSIGDESFVGFRAVLFGASVGRGVYVGAGAIVQDVRTPDGSAVPPGRCVLEQAQASELPGAAAGQRGFMNSVIEANLALVAGYGAAARPTPAHRG